MQPELTQDKVYSVSWWGDFGCTVCGFGDEYYRRSIYWHSVYDLYRVYYYARTNCPSRICRRYGV